MLFNSLQFAVFLPVVLGVYWVLGFKWQNRLLLVASYVFYGAWDYRFCGLMALSTVVDYFLGRGIGAARDDATRKRMLLVSVLVNLGILSIFKYYGFFVDSAIHFLGVFGLHPNPPLLQILLPVGISFYTFTSISYTFDIYRRRVEPVTSIWTYGLYVSYFPHLVAGPIMRADILLPQLSRPRKRPNSEKIRSGLFLILLGLFKKVAIADPISGVANKAFSGYAHAGSLELLLGMVAFAIQIYGDFCGYTDIARGVSRLFGIELVRNFEQPYLSRNITEFWRCWHISLSTWLHDYLYVPLGGNRNGKWRTYRNLLLTMLLGGLWHGASWTFVVWGGLHGLMLSAHRALGGYAPRGRVEKVRWRAVPSILFTFTCVCLAWVFFRAQDFAQAAGYLTGLFSFRPGPVAFNDVVLVLVSAVLILAVDLSQRQSGLHAPVINWTPALRGAAYAVLVLVLATWIGSEAKPFIYFQF